MSPLTSLLDPPPFPGDDLRDSPQGRPVGLVVLAIVCLLRGVDLIASGIWVSVVSSDLIGRTSYALFLGGGALAAVGWAYCGVRLWRLHYSGRGFMLAASATSAILIVGILVEMPWRESSAILAEFLAPLLGLGVCLSILIYLTRPKARALFGRGRRFVPACSGALTSLLGFFLMPAGLATLVFWQEPLDRPQRFVVSLPSVNVYTRLQSVTLPGSLTIPLVAIVRPRRDDVGFASGTPPVQPETELLSGTSAEAPSISVTVTPPPEALHQPSRLPPTDDASALRDGVTIAPPLNDRVSPVRIGGMIKAPKLTRQVEPRYPEAAIRSGVSATVILEAQVDARGKVTAVKVLYGHPLLNDAAVAAVRQWNYEPLLVDGEPREFILTIVAPFRR
jgi:TonB family protein